MAIAGYLDSGDPLIAKINIWYEYVCIIHPIHTWHMYTYVITNDSRFSSNCHWGAGNKVSLGTYLNSSNTCPNYEKITTKQIITINQNSITTKSSCMQMTTVKIFATQNVYLHVTYSTLLLSYNIFLKKCLF